MAPPADQRWSGKVAEAWSRYWQSEVSSVLLEIDEQGIRRLFSYYDWWLRMDDEWRADLEKFGVGQLLSSGIKGQDTVSAYLDSMAKLERLMAALEERCGITPLVRARLGIKVGQAVQTADKLNKLTRKRRGGT